MEVRSGTDSGKHPFADSVGHAFHALLKHVGMDFLLFFMRQYFWITNGLKRIRRDRFVCRQNRAKAGEKLMGA